MTDKLKPCPFCGSDDIEHGMDEEYICNFCGGCWHGTEGTGNWNTRPIEEALQADVKRLRGALENYESALDCPNCQNQGYYMVGSNEEGWNQEQCQFCYTEENSKFNVRSKALTPSAEKEGECKTMFDNEHDGLIKNILAYFKKKHGIYTTGQTYLDIKTLLEKE